MGEECFWAAKIYASVFDGTALVESSKGCDVDTVMQAGSMTNGSAVGAKPLSLTVEVLPDGTGAIHISNSVGTVDAETVHKTLFAALSSNFTVVAAGPTPPGSSELAGSNQAESATQGRDGV